MLLDFYIAAAYEYENTICCRIMNYVVGIDEVNLNYVTNSSNIYNISSLIKCFPFCSNYIEY